jgi:hypothetical protein
MVESTLHWRKAYGTDAIAADNSVPECLLTIARLWVRAHAAITTARAGGAQPVCSQHRPSQDCGTTPSDAPTHPLVPTARVGRGQDTRCCGSSTRRWLDKPLGVRLWEGRGGGRSTSPAPPQRAGAESLPPPWARCTDAAFHHGKVGDGPLIRSRVKLLEAVRLCV